ncbi:ATPase 7, plasma membrane-type [Frankliniella fusca]|uniref:ATPase 7, plasma membrane-type n=1 Tax=Frankliniella fusca TaxID=407009 RepID=A0AAE1H477_9NEOP|nr:ATPase 7, plasma membrane-type [Frankliniella fusca]
MSVNSDQDYPKASQAMHYGGVLSYCAGIFLIMAFCGPYWIQSYKETFSPFKHMGLWEYCFENYRYPYYQSDHLFHGCHHIFSQEYYVIREWLIPGWLMVVQTFVTLALLLSFTAQILAALTLIRWPLKFVLRYEWLLTGLCFIFNASASALLFLAVSIFGGQCWRRDWIEYPNYNYLSWSYAFAVISFFFHGFAAYSLFFESRRNYEQRRANSNLVMQMYPEHARNGYM